MSDIVLGCDYNGMNDSGCQNAVAKVLEKAGHTVEKLGIGPNQFASYSYSGSAKGKIGVFLIASGITAIADLYDGNTNFKYAYFGIRGDLKQPRLSTMSDFKSSPISKDKHGDCISKSCDSLAGKTYPQMNEVTKSKCIAVFGETCDELGNNIIKAMGGETSSSDESTASSTSIKDALKKAVSGWDGEVEIKLIDDTVYVNKIPDPTKSKLILNEFENVQYDTVTVTDVNPQTVNKLILHYEDYDLVLKDDILIKRFGEIPQEIEPDDTVKDYETAVSFIERAWGKIRRDDGRQVELKINGNMSYRVGQWIRVFLPSFFIDNYMYITRMSNDEDGTNNWSTGLTLVDYPPSFGAETETETEEETDEDEDTEVDESTSEEETS